MSRLIEIQDVERLPPEITLRVGDLLWVPASGGRVHLPIANTATSSGVQLLGIFVQAVLGLNGEVVAPEGPPNAVLFVARNPGKSLIDIMTGDPWQGSRIKTLLINVET
jgi:hypothetical protein